ncbi:MAG: co-chaperone GroES [bacterium]|nr:co-chaperone GroES [bacterium]
MKNAKKNLKQLQEKAKQKTRGGSKIMPLGDRVLVRPIDENEGEKTASGIYIPDSVKKEGKFKKGEVMAIGDGWYQDGDLIPLRVRVGDIVFYPTYVGEEFEIDEKDYVLIKEDNILAIIK